LRRRFEGNPAAITPFVLSVGNYVLFGDRMAEHRQALAVQEVQNSRIHTTFADPKFVDSIPEQIGQRPPQFVPK
jgi:hypothetical protein